MDIKNLSDLELAKLLSEQQDFLNQAIGNVQTLKLELKLRLDKAVPEEKKEEEIK